MKHLARQIGMTVLALAILVGSGYVLYKIIDASADPYLEAAKDIEAQFGDYVDVTFIGPIEERPDVLLYVVIIKQNFPAGDDRTIWTAYNALVSQKLVDLLTDDQTLVSYAALDKGANGIFIAEFNADRLRADRNLDTAIMNVYPINGKPFDTYLKWRDK